MRLFLASAALMLVPFAAHAAPPEGAKLSEIVSKLEQNPDLHYIDEIDWDDDGYYEVEYYTKDRSKVEVKIDPKTGEARR